MKVINILMLMIVFQSCNSIDSTETNKQFKTHKNFKEVINQSQEIKDYDSDCIELNDSALLLFMHEQKFKEALILINLAIECDSSNLVFVRNKLVILLNGKYYEECLLYLEQEKDQVRKLEYFTTNAECYFNLDNETKFTIFKNEALEEVKRMFNQNKDESNLITYISVLDRFFGETAALQKLNEHKNILSEGMYDSIIGMMNKIPTLNSQQKR